MNIISSTLSLFAAVLIVAIVKMALIDNSNKKLERFENKLLDIKHDSDDLNKKNTNQAKQIKYLKWRSVHTEYTFYKNGDGNITVRYNGDVIGVIETAVYQSCGAIYNFSTTFRWDEKTIIPLDKIGKIRDDVDYLVQYACGYDDE